MNGKSKRVLMFRGYERFWHWSQAALMIGMAVTGFEIHGSYTLLGFELAIEAHVLAAWALIVLWVFTIFWHFTTGEFRQYLPRAEGVWRQVQYYMRGIFVGEPAPFHATPKVKHNPLQRLAYLGLKLFMIPLIWLSGLLYLFYNEEQVQWLVNAGASLEVIAVVHVAAAYLMLVFLVVHLYLITTGDTIGQHLKAMVTGWEEVADRDPDKSGS